VRVTGAVNKCLLRRIVAVQRLEMMAGLGAHFWGDELEIFFFGDGLGAFELLRHRVARSQIFATDCDCFGAGIERFVYSFKPSYLSSCGFVFVFFFLTGNLTRGIGFCFGTISPFW